MSDILTKIKEKLEIIEIQKQEMVKELQTEFPKLFAEFFEKSNKLDSFSWDQYTPYFNDGDSCHFCVHEISRINDEDIYDLEEDLSPELDEIINQIQEILNSIPDEFMEDLFGDHTTVTVKRDGTIKTEQCEHD